MKKIISICIAVFFSLVSIAQNGAKIEFVKEMHDFGDVPKGPDIVHVFEFKNTGDQPLVLIRCNGSCECTKPKCPGTPTMPGATGKIEVLFETKDKKGTFNKSVYIKCNAVNIDENKGAVEIYIKGNVLPSATDIEDKKTTDLIEKIEKPQISVVVKKASTKKKIKTKSTKK